MGFGDDPGRESRQHDQEVLDEIRRLFARKHETTRLGQLTEHDEPTEPRPEHPDQVQAVPEP
jgi:hypothetical protein